MKIDTAPKRPSWRHRVGHSIKGRLVALFLLLGLGMTAAFLYGTQKAMSLGWRDAVRPLLFDYVNRLANDLGTPPDPARVQALVARLPISVRIEGPVTQLDTHPGNNRFDRGGGGGNPGGYGSQGRWDRHAHDDMDHEGEGPRLLRRVTSDGHTITFGLGDLNWRRGPGIVFWITLTALLALTGVAYWVVRRLLQPLDDIGAGARRFGAGQFTEPIPVRRADELGDLATQINTMGRDIHDMLEAKRALLLAISHELRSPLTRARLNTELLPDGAETQVQREALLRDLAEMARLISDLLESERLASRHAALQPEPVNMAELARQVVGSFAPEDMPPDSPQDSPPDSPPEAPPEAPQDAPAEAHQRAAAPARIQLLMADDVPTLMLDPVRMRLLLRNLLDNALRYTPAGAPPCELAIRVAGDQLVMSVRDHGPGVTDAQLPLLMQPFYRPDSARQRSTGGVGLGLYLCQLVAKAHGGQLVLSHAHPGLQATVTLPRVRAGSAGFAPRP